MTRGSARPFANDVSWARHCGTRWSRTSSPFITRCRSPSRPAKSRATKRFCAGPIRSSGPFRHPSSFRLPRRMDWFGPSGSGYFAGPVWTQSRGISLAVWPLMSRPCNSCLGAASLGIRRAQLDLHPVERTFQQTSGLKSIPISGGCSPLNVGLANNRTSRPTAALLSVRRERCFFLAPLGFPQLHRGTYRRLQLSGSCSRIYSRSG